jgi:hypothetical protein
MNANMKPMDNLRYGAGGQFREALFSPSLSIFPILEIIVKKFNIHKETKGFVDSREYFGLCNFTSLLINKV